MVFSDGTLGKHGEANWRATAESLRDKKYRPVPGSAKLTLFHINWGDGDDAFVIAPDKETAISKVEGMVNSVVQLDALYNMIYEQGKRDRDIELEDAGYVLLRKKNPVAWLPSCVGWTVVLWQSLKGE